MSAVELNLDRLEPGRSVLEFDTVIDPIYTRAWITGALKAAPTPAPRDGKKRPFVDSW